MLADYPGTVLVVSHDRDFLDRVVTSVFMAEGEGRFVEYAGGYSDMLAQRRLSAGVEEPGAVKVKKSSTAKPRRTKDAPPSKLSFNDKHALETLPSRITALEKEIAVLHTQLADSDFYLRDPKGFAAASARLEKAQTDLATAEERWLELEILREDLTRQ
jgi:ATP-binding cassette subfamily F protein uup